MKNLLFFLLISFSTSTISQIQFLQLPNNNKFSAIFPCKTENKSIKSSIGLTNAIQCRVENYSNVCLFLIAEQPLDVYSFKKNES